VKILRAVGGFAIPLVWLLSVLVASGCSSQPQNASLGREALQNLTPLEKKILADKLVSAGEYRSAQQDTVDCLRTAGFRVVDLVQAADGTLDYSTSYEVFEKAAATTEPAPPDMSTMDARHVACEKRSAGVAAVFVLQHKTSLIDRPLPGLKEALKDYKG
jgi:hypothetical protein